MNIYNSLTKKVEIFVPINEEQVGIYSCGPTVYDLPHIGNLSAFIYADTLRRILEFDYKVHHVMNITDVDDKTIRNSIRDYPDKNPTEALSALTTKYSRIFKEDLKETGNQVDHINFISAVDSIQSMIQLTQELLDGGIAYIADDGVYFSIQKYQNTGKTYGILQKIEVANGRSRINNDEYDKENVSDFALWKKAQPGEPSWKATFKFQDNNYDIEGRPGWHIECSAMSKKLLGIPFDIHTGGIDLKFPHHENEIAQSCGAGANKLANYFFHNNHMLVDGKKMSKSLGNSYTLSNIEEKGYLALDFRLLVLESHYRSENNFSWNIMKSAHNRLSTWYEFSDKQFQTSKAPSNWVAKTLSSFKDLLLENLRNDLNTPKALSEISKIVSLHHDHPVGENELENFLDLLETLDRIFGLDLNNRLDLKPEQKELLARRTQARINKNWKQSDELRSILLQQGIGVRDIKDSQSWFRV